MTRLRMTVLAILVAVCALALAPATEAAAVSVTPRGPALASDGGGWVPSFLSWLTERARALAGGLRAVVSKDGSCVDPNRAPVPCPAGDAPVLPQGDSGICVDPDGAQAPCNS